MHGLASCKHMRPWINSLNARPRDPPERCYNSTIGTPSPQLVFPPDSVIWASCGLSSLGRHGHHGALGSVVHEPPSNAYVYLYIYMYIHLYALSKYTYLHIFEYIHIHNISEESIFTSWLGDCIRGLASPATSMFELQRGSGAAKPCRRYAPPQRRNGSLLPRGAADLRRPSAVDVCDAAGHVLEMRPFLMNILGFQALEFFGTDMLSSLHFFLGLNSRLDTFTALAHNLFASPKRSRSWWLADSKGQSSCLFLRLGSCSASLHR